MRCPPCTALPLGGEKGEGRGERGEEVLYLAHNPWEEGGGRVWLSSSTKKVSSHYRTTNRAAACPNVLKPLQHNDLTIS